MDNVIEHHTKFLDACMRDCMINSDQFLDIHKILGVCMTFSEFVQAVTHDTKMKEESAKYDSRIGLRAGQEKKKMLLQVSLVYSLALENYQTS